MERLRLRLQRSGIVLLGNSGNQTWEWAYQNSVIYTRVVSDAPEIKCKKVMNDPAIDILFKNPQLITVQVVFHFHLRLKV